ncbi:Glycoside hydrolase/deacetylase, beta/alpha-barrel [Acididesulfobacillus acetoxydans]|uniref:Glycoside hydrolase/deacetylase, beta/alpha-barrel n=1 Tax=Acididesulfobacillus acetoxydans TaxID=1561005 RepID=A0A8S0WVK5_9FIRM|nr:polysaccharide deacetylase family protein [Acididesulfobacillus acetoxydans]CAA7599661.1 Glycoside hydrolase/deacetylase, beta/alpha-barrel [Acididesulfobacillus acetoxydans]CEJ06213.1 Polysaccharide deacetylase [Acididesulfobacillus acetoxydans]
MKFLGNRFGQGTQRYREVGVFISIAVVLGFLFVWHSSFPGPVPVQHASGGQPGKAGGSFSATRSDPKGVQSKATKTNPPAPAAPALTPFPKEGIPVLMYHSISTIPGNTLGVPVRQFSAEMTWLHRRGYHSLSPEELYRALTAGEKVPEKPILLTFDDGYADNYYAAWPILRANGFRATFFVITNSVGPGMMTWNRLAELVRAGNSIGSHTVHHLDLASLPAKEQEDELALSKQTIKSHLGLDVQAFCFPSGRYNTTTLQLMSKLGYRIGFTTHSGRVHLGDNPLILKRLRIYGGMPLSSFERLLP